MQLETVVLEETSSCAERCAMQIEVVILKSHFGFALGEIKVDKLCIRNAFHPQLF